MSFPTNQAVIALHSFYGVNPTLQSYINFKIRVLIDAIYYHV